MTPLRTGLGSSLRALTLAIASTARRRAPSLACLVLSLGFFGALVGTHSPMADRWSALPFAAFAWAGFLCAAAAVVVARKSERGLPSLFVSAWLVLWMSTWSAGVQDAIAFVQMSITELIVF